MGEGSGVDVQTRTCVEEANVTNAVEAVLESCEG